MFKVYTKDTKMSNRPVFIYPKSTMGTPEQCSKLTIKTPERRH